MTFDYTANMNVYVTINGNDNEGFDNINNNMKLTQWSVNGHYYLYVPENFRGRKHIIVLWDLNLQVNKDI